MITVRLNSQMRMSSDMQQYGSEDTIPKEAECPEAVPQPGPKMIYTVYREKETNDDRAPKFPCTCASCTCFFSIFGLMMWIALLVLWLGGLYIADDIKASGSCSDLSLARNATAIEDPQTWWITSSNIIVIITFCASVLCCCSVVTLCCCCKILSYVSLGGIAISVLFYTVLAAWIGLGTMMANDHACANYSLYLTLFYVYMLVLIAFCIASALWKSNRISGGRHSHHHKNAENIMFGFFG